MSCQSCDALVIQGVFCHEKGCPDAWRDSVRECRWCGTEYKPEEPFQRFCGDDCKHAFEGHDGIVYAATSSDD